MDNIMDIFGNDAFSVVSLTQAINMTPNLYGRLNQLNLFPQKPVSSTVVAVEVKHGVLHLIPSVPRGGPANLHTHGTRGLKRFDVPHFPVEDRITAADVERVRAFGTANKLLGVIDLVNERQLEMAANHHITLEYLRNGALKGQVMDPGGGVLLDLFSEFGIEEKVVDFALDVEATNVAAQCKAVSRHIEGHLKGEVMTYVHALCASDFFDALTNHPKVLPAFQAQEGNTLSRDDLRKGFKYQGIMWEEYVGEASTAEGDTTKFIPDGTCRFFPMGTASTFATYVAPADFLETVNTMGVHIYSKIAPDAKYNRYVELFTQSNALPICLRPAVLVKGTKAAGE